jgi:hypothetical protein
MSEVFTLRQLGSRLWFQTACAILIAAPFFAVLIQLAYLPGLDETYQLEAAVNLASGRGYVATREIAGDLSTPSFTYLTGWPRGYSLLVAAAIAGGASFALAAKLVKLVTIALAMAAWLLLARRFVVDLISTLFFCGFISFFVVVCSESPTDLLILALFPLLLDLLLRLEEVHPIGKYSTHQDTFICVLAGALVGLAVALKYTAIPMVLVGMGWIGYASRANRVMLLRNLAFFLAPAALVIGPLFLANYLNARSFSTVTDISIKGPLLGWHAKWIVESLTAFLVDAAYLPKIVIRNLLTQFFPGQEAAMRTLATGCLLAVLILASVGLIRRGDPGRKLVALTAISYGSATLFLGAAASLFYYDSEWNPLQHGRYYQWAIPEVVLCLLLAVSPFFSRVLQGRGKVVAVALVALPMAGFVGLNALFAMHIFRTTNLINTDAQLAYQKIHSIWTAEQTQALVVFADSDNFRAAPWKGEISIHFASVSFPPESYFSRNTVVAMLCSRSGSWELYSGNNACQSLGFDDAAARFDFKKETVGVRNTLYWRVFSKGPSPK